MTRTLPRRRFLAISAAACAVPAASAAEPRTLWHGQALGAAASLRIEGLAPEDGQSIVIAVRAELTRLERIFSLYRPGSALLQLNAEGHLQYPPPELLEALALCDRLNSATAGAFDPTVQPLFLLAATGAAHGKRITAENTAKALWHVGWQGVRYNSRAVTLRAGQAVTLNGVAHGIVTDRVASLLKSQGLTDVLVDIGEIAALGHPAGKPGWTVGIAAPDGAVLTRITLKDRAVATSAPRGTVLDPAGRVGHIFDPRTGAQANGAALVSVSSPSAAVADGLSTGLCAMPAELHSEALSLFPDARLEALAKT